MAQHLRVEAELPREAVPQDMVVLGIFQNDVGRLLTDPKQYWVDLNLIKPDESTASYLQASLEYMAKRVHVTSFALINLVDQVSLVEPLGEDLELQHHQQYRGLERACQGGCYQ